MMRYVLLGLATLIPGGCLDFQADYDNAARRDCRDLVNADERRACLFEVEQNSSERRAERRS